MIGGRWTVWSDAADFSDAVLMQLVGVTCLCGPGQPEVAVGFDCGQEPFELVFDEIAVTGCADSVHDPTVGA